MAEIKKFPEPDKTPESDQSIDHRGERGAELSKGGTYMSRIRASRDYEKKVKQLTIRVSATAKDQLDAYAEEHHTSVNALVLKLLEKETGIDLHTK